jgi:hypothetical protein
MSGGTVKDSCEQGVLPGDYVVHLQGWDTAPPTAEGWYWAIHYDQGDQDRRGATIVQYVGNSRVVCGKWSLDPVETGVADFTHWLGPLPVPELPKKAGD